MPHELLNHYDRLTAANVLVSESHHRVAEKGRVVIFFAVSDETRPASVPALDEHAALELNEKHLLRECKVSSPPASRMEFELRHRLEPHRFQLERQQIGPMCFEFCHGF